MAGNETPTISMNNLRINRATHTPSNVKGDIDELEKEGRALSIMSAVKSGPIKNKDLNKLPLVSSSTVKIIKCYFPVVWYKPTNPVEVWGGW